MKAIKNFLSDFKKSFLGNAYISSYTGVQAAGEFFRLFLGPFYLTMILGFLILATGERWDGILLNAIDEFVQMTGLKLSFYLLIGLVGFSFIFYEVDWLTKILSLVVKSLSHVAFTMFAVFTGVLWGIVLPLCVEAGGDDPFYELLALSMFPILASVVLFFSAKIFSTGVREEIDKTLGRHTRKFTLGMGVFLMIVFIKTFFFDEPWEEVTAEPQCQEAPTSDYGVNSIN